MASAFDIIQVVTEFLWLGETVLNVWHALSPSAVSDSDVVDDLTEGMDDMYTLINGALDNNFEYVQITLKNITANEDLLSHAWPVLTTGGAGDLSSLPLGVAGLITFPTAIPGVRGRKFLAGFTENGLADSLFVSGVTDVLADMGAFAVTGFVGAASSEAWAFGVPDQTGAFRDFTGAVVKNIPSYQRRRKQGVGE